MQRISCWLIVALVGLAACADDAVDPDLDDPGAAPDSAFADPRRPDGRFVPDAPVFEEAHPRVYLVRHRDRLVAALEAGTAAATRFLGTVDAQLGGADIYGFEAWFAALAGQLTDEPRYCAHAVAAVDATVAAEEARIAGGARPQLAADSYLEIGPRLGEVLLTYDWCFEHTTADQRRRWLALSAQAVWNVWNHQDARWGDQAFPWSGWSVDNPSNNYYYSFLRATMLFGLVARGEHPDAAGWLAFFQTEKMHGQLLPTFEAELVGGGSREGTGYGVAMMRLWGIYHLWQGSTGEDLARQTSHSRASLLHFLHQTVPTLDRIAPTGDHSRDSTAVLFDYHRDYVQSLIDIFRDDPLAGAAASFLAQSSVPRMTRRELFVQDFLHDVTDVPARPLSALGRAYHGTGTGQVYARSSWDPDATWINLIAGPYTESHAHHDQGALMIYKGSWLGYDANVASHSGIRQAEELHNLVRITEDGATVRQREGTTSAVTALHRGDGWLHVAADLTAAYDGHAAVSNVEREVVFIEPDVVVVFDRVTTAAGTQQVWQLNSPAAPSVSGARATVQGSSHRLIVQRVAPDAATTVSRAWAAMDDDIDGGHRLDTTVAGGANQLLHVLSIDDAVTRAVRSDAAGRTGVEITLGDGRRATVRFGAAGVDGTLELRAAGGGVATSVALAPGVDALPE